MLWCSWFKLEYLYSLICCHNNNVKRNDEFPVLTTKARKYSLVFKVVLNRTFEYSESSNQGGKAPKTPCSREYYSSPTHTEPV